MALQQAAIGRVRGGSARRLFSTTPLARSLLFGAAIVGLGELSVHRVGGAVTGGVVAPQWLEEAVGLGGAGLVAAAAILAFALALALVLSPSLESWPRLGVGLAASSVLLFPVLAPTAESTVHVAVMVATAVVVLRAAGSITHRVAVFLIGLSVVTGQAALIVTSSSPALRVAGEAAWITGVLVLAVIAGHDRSVPTRGWIGAVASGSVVALAFAFSPGYTAMASFWALGATLSLPPVLYIAGAAATGLLTVTWLGDRARRHLAAGLVLLAVAGLVPTLAHHNLTAVLAVAGLASTHWPPQANRSQRQ